MTLLICATPFGAPSEVAWSQSLPPSLRACAAETDAQRRLACYDRETARSGEAPRPTTPAPPPASTPPPVLPPPTSSAPQPSPTAQAEHSSQAQKSSRADTTPSSDGKEQPADSGANGSATETKPGMMDRARAMLKKATGQDSDGKATARVSAHLTSIEGLPNELVLRLDNGQVWQQLEAAPGVLSLRPGDAVTIEKHLGSYWLSGPHISSLKVRQKH
jgi:hypothetical protein